MHVTKQCVTSWIDVRIPVGLHGQMEENVSSAALGFLRNVQQMRRCWQDGKAEGDIQGQQALGSL
jgi:hypothetical protein